MFCPYLEMSLTYLKGWCIKKGINIHIFSKIFPYISSILYITELVPVDHLWLKIVLIFRILPIQPPIALLEQSHTVSAHVKMVMFYKTFSSHLILDKGPYFYYIKLTVSFNPYRILHIYWATWSIFKVFITFPKEFQNKWYINWKDQ